MSPSQHVVERQPARVTRLLCVTGTVAKIYGKLAADLQYDFSVVGIGDVLTITEKTRVHLTAVQFNEMEDNFADIEGFNEESFNKDQLLSIPVRALSFASLSRLRHLCKRPCCRFSV